MGGQTLQKEVGWEWGGQAANGRAGGSGDLDHPTADRKAAREHRRGHGIQIGRAGQSRVDGAEPLRGLQQQGWGIAAAARDERQLSAHQVEAGLCELVERSGFGDGQQIHRGVQRPRLDLRGRGVERPHRPFRRVDRQHRGTFEERRRRGEATPGLRAARRLREFVGDVVIGSRRRVRAVPGPPVGVVVRVDHLGEGAVRGLSFQQITRAVGHRAGEGVVETDVSAEVGKTGFDRGRGRIGTDSEPRGRTPHQGGIACRFGRSDQQQPPRAIRKVGEPPRETLLEAAGVRHRTG